MNLTELTTELTLAGLRLASDNEAGWTYTYLTDDASDVPSDAPEEAPEGYEGERVTVWVTDLS